MRMVISPARFEDEIRIIDNRIESIENKHRAADDLLCEVLDSLGYSEGVAIFKQMEKWYS